MKLRILFAAVIAAVAVLSCQREELIPEENVLDGATLTFTSENAGSTKTEWNGSTIIWSAGDAISVAYTLDGVWNSALYASDALAEAASTAGFIVPTDLAPETTGTLTFYGIHPAMADGTDFSSAPSLTVTVPSNQTPGAATYDKAADVMVAKAMVDYTSVPDKAIPLLWNRGVAHADLTLTNLAVSTDETPEKLIITAQQDAQLAGDFTLDVASSKYSLSGNASNSLTLDLSALTISDAGALRVWAVLMPTEITSLNVELVTSKSRYIREITEMTADFSANTRNVLTVDMSTAEKLTRPEDDSTINMQVFELLNLDYPGLETVKAEYEAGNYGVAAAALVDYFRTRSVVNPEVDLSVKKLYSEDARIADQLLEHRICVRKGKWYESVTTDENGTKRYTYYDFDDAETDEIDWYFVIPDIGQEDYQLHWHDYFKYLAWAQKETGDDKYIECWKELYSDWLETFPGPEGNNLWESFYNKAWHQLSTSNRIANQLNNLPYFLTSSAFTGSWMSEFLVRFHELVEFDRAHTYHDLTSNVTFEQYTARATAGILMPEFKNSQTWVSDVAPLISDQFTVQFFEDGVHTEMTPKYHMGVLDNFRVIYNLARANNRLSDFTPDYTEKMRAAALFLANYVYPNYTWEMFNDSGRQTENVLKKTIARYSEFFPDENVLTYLGSGRTEGTEPTESLIPYPDGGYYIFRNHWRRDGMMFILKNNNDPNNEPHVHSDNGTFGLFNNGRNFLPDAGIYTYGGTTELDAKREQYLATANHNTLTMNLETIATGYSLGECLLTRTSATEDLVVTQNPSYADLTHRRAVYMLDKEFFVIVDEAFGSAEAADINLSFHLCAGEIVVDDNSSAYSYGVHTTFDDGNNMLLRTFSETATGFTGETGLSYCSENENEEFARPYYRVTVDKTAASDVTRFITVIYPATSAEISAEFTTEFSQSSSSVKVTVGDKEYNLSYTL